MPTGIYKRTKEHGMNISKANSGVKNWGFGRKLSLETRKKKSETMKRIGFIPPSSLGRIVSKETRKKMSEAHKGEKAPGWKGGITPMNRLIRSSLEYKLWRESVFKRDNYTCQECWQYGGNLNADHIKPFAYYPELRFAIDNGRTLCLDCHKKTGNYLNRWFYREFEIRDSLKK